MARVFTNNEASLFRSAGFEVGGKKATVRLEAAGFDLTIAHDGFLTIEGRCRSGAWRRVHEAPHENPTRAACVAATLLYAVAAVDLFAVRAVEAAELAEVIADGCVSLEDTIAPLPECTVEAVCEQAEITAEPIAYVSTLFVGRKPETITRFLARHGGIQHDGDLRANDIHKLFVPGFGKLIRKEGSGLSLDKARLLAQEAGYLPEDCPTKPSECDINMLLEAIVADASGDRVVSRFDYEAEARLQVSVESYRLAARAEHAMSDGAPF